MLFEFEASDWYEDQMELSLTSNPKKYASNPLVVCLDPLPDRTRLHYAGLADSLMQAIRQMSAVVGLTLTMYGGFLSLEQAVELAHPSPLLSEDGILEFCQLSLKWQRLECRATLTYLVDTGALVSFDMGGVAFYRIATP